MTPTDLSSSLGVRVWSTFGSVLNPGLMQDHAGSATCNTGVSGTVGTVQNPCPQSMIQQMVTEGTAGTSAGDGLKQCIATAACTDVSMYYKAARIYNSGSLPADGNLGEDGATDSYSMDVANRLLGWTG